MTVFIADSIQDWSRNDEISEGLPHVVVRRTYRMAHAMRLDTGSSVRRQASLP
jgi:hypothetical protein